MTGARRRDGHEHAAFPCYCGGSYTVEDVREELRRARAALRRAELAPTGLHPGSPETRRRYERLQRHRWRIEWAEKWLAGNEHAEGQS